MPKKAANIAISRMTRCFLKQSATKWSIIESNPTPHDDPIAGAKTALDDSGGALLRFDLDIAALERPVRDLDEDACCVVGHQQRGGRHHEPGHGRRDEGGSR